MSRLPNSTRRGQVKRISDEQFAVLEAEASRLSKPKNEYHDYDYVRALLNTVMDKQFAVTYKPGF